jgi:hypothetical protein
MKGCRASDDDDDDGQEHGGRPGGSSMYSALCAVYSLRCQQLLFRETLCLVCRSRRKVGQAQLPHVCRPIAIYMLITVCTAQFHDCPVSGLRVFPTSVTGSEYRQNLPGPQRTVSHCLFAIPHSSR